MSVSKSLANITAAAIVAGVAGALALAPVAGISGVGIARTNETMQSNLADLTDGTTPGVTTITDSTGQPMAWLYNQRRYPVSNEQISQHMKDAIVAIEDHRFYEHDGVDIQGTVRAMATNVLAGGVEQGASTINQQYVKNYLLFIDAENEAEQAAAVEQSIPRKLREMRMASDLDRNLSKDDILTRYLNLVPFGNRSFGIEAAARTYFGISAAELSVPQSALLAGMVQSSEYLNPYTNPDGATQRRDTVLRAMANQGVITAEQADAHIAEPLGVLESPATLPNGCIAAGDRGFFCDYALTYLESKGVEKERLMEGGYTITTTLDPQVQDAARAAVSRNVDPMTTGVAEVMNVVEPGTESRDILAMTSSRNYGLNLDAGETVLPQPSSLVGNGAGSVFKVFTAAAAIEQGMGLETVLDVPDRYEAEGLGTGGARNCPPNTYCVENAGNYKDQMTLREALAHSPNTTFIQLIEQVGVPAVVDMSVKLGLRSYEVPGTFDGESSIAEYMKNANLGSYTLGPTAVNPLELSNVGATLASGGRWCEPNPIVSVTDREGQEIFLERPACEQALDSGVANALAGGMAEDLITGTGARAANVTGWGGQAAAKTGTTESHLSSAFLGFNSGFAAAPYIYNDGTSSSPLCTSPVRQCGSGDLFGGREAAESWFQTANQVPAALNGGLAGHDPKYDLGTTHGVLAEVVGMTEQQARSTLEGQGYRVEVRTVDGTQPRGRVERALNQGILEPGSTVIIELSRGVTQAPAPQPAPAPRQPSQSPPPIPQIPDLTQEDIDEMTNQLRDALGL
ncbi:Membrane carboxypeptidase (penicillin-binding protein) [Corynebacterium pollutisoli]|uniref:Membrane carboxypeptidase (Penicillin-binding protein) n=1 Tax=Corynebacterium pollutisoli TaxID=1610489 RepID=A0A1X7IKI9_9CORY|nr:transglycosylase domain-containing protein [Corynebacterium pollutisoli]SMG15274.1 Membrane carboxypeptidase (penicillin-binding protein) [Corynebacterium pollutisoli]